jgi:hypothetical protein
LQAGTLNIINNTYVQTGGSTNLSGGILASGNTRGLVHPGAFDDRMSS